MASEKASLFATSSPIPAPISVAPDSVLIGSGASAPVEVDTRFIFPFLKLPAEIRNRIYDLVFVSDDYIGANATLTKAFYHEAAKYRNLAFASACRQIYQESANIFYAKNGFEFFYIRPFLEFLEAIGVKRRMLLTKLKYNYSNGTPFVVLRYLKSCKNLAGLEISARVVMTNRKTSWWAYPLKDAKGFFLGSNSVIEFGDVRKFGKAGQASKEPPLARIETVKSPLTESLMKVKREESGHYKR